MFGPLLWIAGLLDCEFCWVIAAADDAAFDETEAVAS